MLNCFFADREQHEKATSRKCYLHIMAQCMNPPLKISFSSGEWNVHKMP